MKPPKTVFACQECGAQSAKWLGRCPDCGAWNSMVEERPMSAAVAAAATERRYTLAAAAGPQLYADIDTVVGERLSTGIDEFDRVLGGGVVPGSLVLIGGEPGIGKSTLLLQAAAHFAKVIGPVLYCSGEESEHQIKARGERLGVGPAPLYILAETCLERILEEVARLRPAFLIVDSIQTVFSLKFQSAPGSIGQVRESATQLLFAAKGQNIPTFLVGHVTKDGNLAGPKALEHIVDTVLYFEGDPHSSFRLVRAIKNRFGAANELGVFAMTERGLKGVANPSALFLSQHGQPVPGSCILATVEGSRPMLVEVQALVDPTQGGLARRLAVGLDAQRLALLLAVLHRHGGVETGNLDVYVNAVGGMRIGEPAADLAVLLAVYSSLKNKPIESKSVVFGEVGLAGEIRPVQRGQERLREAAKLGFHRALIPAPNRPKQGIEGIEILTASRIDEALRLIMI